jgi:hypothetical protein
MMVFATRVTIAQTRSIQVRQTVMETVLETHVTTVLIHQIHDKKTLTMMASEMLVKVFRLVEME